MTNEEAINYAYGSDDPLVKRLLNVIVELEMELSYLQFIENEQSGFYNDPEYVDENLEP